MTNIFVAVVMILHCHATFYRFGHCIFSHKFLIFLFIFSGNKYLQKSSVSRICAVGGFFISIPIFLTGNNKRSYYLVKLILNFLFSLIDRYHFVHIYSIPFNASDNNKHFDWHRNRILRLCHGAQCLCMAKRENDMRS